MTKTLIRTVSEEVDFIVALLFFFFFFPYVHLLRNEKGIGRTQTQRGEREREHTRGPTVRLNGEIDDLAR